MENVWAGPIALAFLWHDHFSLKVLARKAACSGFNLGNNPQEVAAFRVVVKRSQVITDCASLCVTAGWHCLWSQMLRLSPQLFVSTEICQVWVWADPPFPGRKAGKAGSYLNTAVPHQTTRVPVHSQERLLCHCQQQELSEKIKKNQIGSLWPMELIQGLLCGKTHPTSQEKPGRQSGTDYSLCRDFTAGSTKMNFLNTCFLLAFSSSANPGSYTVMYNASKWKRKQQGTLKIVILILRLCF